MLVHVSLQGQDYMYLIASTTCLISSPKFPLHGPYIFVSQPPLHSLCVQSAVDLKPQLSFFCVGIYSLQAQMYHMFQYFLIKSACHTLAATCKHTHTHTNTHTHTHTHNYYSLSTVPTLLLYHNSQILPCNSGVLHSSYSSFHTM